ncbi:MAG: metallophosphoesterase [Actinobacteria bacterium]|jgi:putative phosphoesterase|nr:MAG: metallophosphoesterase [Actinomycetota bacterium]
MARVILVADTHIPKVGPALPGRLLEEFAGADLILHAGDLIEMSVMEELSALAPTRAVVGNMDLPEVRSLLPEKVVVEVEGKLIGLIHGWGPPMGIERRVLSRFSGVDVVVFGHTHKALVEERKGTMLVNPGTPNDRRFSDRLSYAVLTIEKGVMTPEIIWLD